MCSKQKSSLRWGFIWSYFDCKYSGAIVEMMISKLIAAALTLMATATLSHASPETDALAQK